MKISDLIRKASPLPWVVSPDPPDQVVISHDGRTVCEMHPDMALAVGCGRDADRVVQELKDRAAADARLAVFCVNAHQVLLSALVQARERFETMRTRGDSIAPRQFLENLDKIIKVSSKIE